MTDQQLLDDITRYLGNGGLFNPELMNAEQTRDLLMKCRQALEQRWMPLNGMDIRVVVHLTIPETYTHTRTWRERLFSWPWAPWTTIERRTRQIPDPQAYVVGHTLYMHPSTFEAMKLAMTEKFPGTFEFQPGHPVAPPMPFVRSS